MCPTAGTVDSIYVFIVEDIKTFLLSAVDDLTKSLLNKFCEQLLNKLSHSRPYKGGWNIDKQASLLLLAPLLLPGSGLNGWSFKWAC